MLRMRINISQWSPIYLDSERKASCLEFSPSCTVYLDNINMYVVNLKKKWQQNEFREKPMF